MSATNRAGEAVERLLTIRPPACPNGLVLLRMLEQVLDPTAARQIAAAIWGMTGSCTTGLCEFIHAIRSDRQAVGIQTCQS